MPASTIEAREPSQEPALRAVPDDTDERRKCDRAVALWRRHCDDQALPRWTDSFLDIASELRAFAVLGSTDQKTAAVLVDEIGHYLRKHLSKRDPGWEQTASCAAILLKEIVDAAQWVVSGGTPRPVSQSYGDHKCPGRTVKSRFVVLPFAAEHTGAMRWLALGDWCTEID